MSDPRASTKTGILSRLVAWADDNPGHRPVSLYDLQRVSLEFNAIVADARLALRRAPEPVAPTQPTRKQVEEKLLARMYEPLCEALTGADIGEPVDHPARCSNRRPCPIHDVAAVATRDEPEAAEAAGRMLYGELRWAGTPAWDELADYVRDRWVRAALSEPKSEPVAWMVELPGGSSDVLAIEAAANAIANRKNGRVVPLYRSPNSESVTP